MTEEEWVSSADLTPMLDLVLDRASNRKLQLFACACCRRDARLLTDDRHRNAVEAAERFADGLLSEAELAEVMRPVVDLWAHIPSHQESAWGLAEYATAATRHLGGGSSAFYAAQFAAGGRACLAGADGSLAWVVARQAEGAAQCELLRDVIGDPSRPFRFDSAWLSGGGAPAVELARAIHDEGRFEALPQLADVLERAGCHDRAVLSHCRGPGEHVRGCWVVDALLGRESAVRAGLMTEADWRACDDPGPLLHFLRDKGNNRQWRLFAVACCRRIDHLITDERSRRAVEVAARYADDAATEEELEAARAAAQEAQREAKDAEWYAEAEANFCWTPEYAAVCCRLHAAQAARSAVCRDNRASDAEPGTFEADRWGPSENCAAAAAADNAYAELAGAPDDARRAKREAARTAEDRAHCEFLRDLFGEHLGPPGGEGCWLPCGPRSPVERPEQWCLLPTPPKAVLRGEWLTWNDGVVRRLARSTYEEQAFEGLPILADAFEEAGCDDAAILAHLRGPGPHTRGCWALDAILGKE